MPRITPVCVIAGVVIVGDCDRACPAKRAARSGLHRLREAEVQHLHRAVGSHLDVRGLQIAVDDPLLVRRFERLGDLPRDRQRFVERDRRRARCAARDPRPRPAPSRGRVDAVRSLPGRRSARCSDDSARRGLCASRWKRARRSGSSAKESGRILSATSRFSFVSRAR